MMRPLKYAPHHRVLAATAAALSQCPAQRRLLPTQAFALLVVPPPRQPQRDFSAASATSAAEASSPSLPFQYPKAQALFEKITSTLQSADEVRALQREMYIILGRPLRNTEFYYDGFGSKRKKGGAGAAGSDASAAAAAAAPEVKTAFDVKLVGFDAAAKIKVIKEIRSISGLGLKEAKELVESAPCVVQKGVKTEAAEEIKAKLIELGAQIELV